MEIGFGVGINFLATCEEWLNESKSKKPLQYIAFDKALFSLKQFEKAIGHYPNLKNFSNEYIKEYPYNIAGTQRISLFENRISLTLILDDIQTSLSYFNNASDIDAWYLDGFSPDKNPDMWSKEIFRQIYRSSHNDSTFSTYASARLVKDNIENSDLTYKIAEGFANKRHMLKGTVKTNKTKELIKQKKVAIIGSGIAGSTLAYTLAERGHKVDLYEQDEEICSRASGNDLLITYPRLSAFDSPYARFCIHSFLFASSFYDRLKTIAWNRCGVLLLNHDDSSLKRQTSLLNARSDDKLFEALSCEEASKKANLKLNNGGMFFKKGGFIEPKILCQSLLTHKNIYQILSTKIEKLDFDGINHKIVTNGKVIEYEEVCLCAGHTSKELIDLDGLSSKRGQISYVDSSNDFENLKFPICGSGYFSPKVNGTHIVGSSYSDIKNGDIDEEEHKSNMEKLKTIHSFDVNIVNGKVGFRAVTKDRMPLVGVKKGIYVNTGHGSRGSTSSPLCAEIIADLIDEKPLPVDDGIANALDLNRFN